MHTLFPPDPWQQIKARLEQKLGNASFRKWIAPLEGTLTSEKEITIPVPDMAFYHGVLTECMDEIERSKVELGMDVCIRLQVMDDDREQFDEDAPAEHPPVLAENENGAFSRALTTQGNLNADYTFDNFVGGPSNQFALASCLKVGENPGQAYNPLFIYGSTGLGKTHLLYAVGNFVLSQNPNAVITYITSERFMNELIYCLRFEKMWEFRQKYRYCDVFLVDDIQFISGKKRTTQEEFFHTFNALYEQKKQIVITSDMFPQDIPDIEDRLRNRFQWGLIADIQPPDVEHRIAILQQKARQLRIRLNHNVAEYIAIHAKKNIRELEGALRRVAAFADLQGRPIDLKMASEIFQSIAAEPSEQITIELVQKVVAEHFKLRVSDLKSKKRQRALTLPRQIAMYLARKLTGASFPEIGDGFGGKDHTTVLHAVRKIEKELGDLDLKAHLESLERKLEQI